MQKVPKVKGWRFSFTKKLRKDPMGYINQLDKQYGDIFYKYHSGHYHYYLCHPQQAEHVLQTNQNNYQKNPILKNFDPFLGKNNLFTTNNVTQWNKDRNLASASFEEALFFEKYTQVIATKCSEMLARWQDKIIQPETSLVVTADLDKLALEIINNTIFYDTNIDVESFVKHIPEIYKIMQEKADSWTRLAWIFPTKKKRRLQKELVFLQNSAKYELNSRLESRKDFDDLLGAFLHAHQVTTAQSKNFTTVGNQLLTFNILGFTPTTMSVRWVLMMLAKHPETEQRMFAELTEVCNGRIPTQLDFLQLKFTRAVVSEVLRLYPLYPFILRQSIAKDVITSFSIPAKANITLNPFLIHRHPDYWKNPDEFNPERFLTKPWGQEYQYAYIPFGAGNRGCIGKNLALLEITLITAMIVQRFHLTLPKDYKLNVNLVVSTFQQSNLESMLVSVRN